MITLGVSKLQNDSSRTMLEFSSKSGLSCSQLIEYQKQMNFRAHLFQTSAETREKLLMVYTLGTSCDRDGLHLFAGAFKFSINGRSTCWAHWKLMEL